MLDLSEQIARVIDEAVAPVTATEARRRAPSRRRARPLPVLAAVAAVIVVAIGVPLSLRGGRQSEMVHVGGGPSSGMSTATSIPSASGRIIGRLDISTIRVHWNVVEGSDAAIEKRGPMHDPATPLPGKGGSSAIVGYRTTHGAPFYRLNELKSGDVITFTKAGETVSYEVDESFVVSATGDSVFPSRILDRIRKRRDSLTLITDNPRYSAAERLVVTSHRIPNPTTTAASASPNGVLARDVTGSISVGARP